MSEKKIFEPAKLNNIVLKNRLIRSATWEGMADIDGHIPDKLYDTYEELAKGGIGAIITGFTSVAGDDHYFGGMVRLSGDELIPEHKRLTDLCHKENCPVIVQIALGEYANGTEPDDMSEEDIHKVTSLFVDAAIRADKAEYDGVQIHAAHGFFLSRFISPASNHRKDGFGGSPQKGEGFILRNMLMRFQK